MVEKKVILQCVKGSQKAFKELYEETIKYTYTIVSRYVDTNDVKDVIQEAYAQIFQSLNKFSPEKGAFKSYIRAIIVNTCLTHQKKKSVIPTFEDIDEHYELKEWDEQLNKFTKLTESDIKNLLSEMPEGYKTIFYLYVIDGFSHKEISEMLEITPETSRTQYFRAKKWIVSNALINNKMSSYGLL